MSAPVLFSITPGDALPIYRQLVEQVKGAIASGLLKAGDRLPSHRDLARDLVIAPLTVKRAYDVLEAEGLIATRRGKGTFVEAETSNAAPEAQSDLDVRVDALVRQARLLGLSVQDVIQKVKRAWGPVRTKRRTRS